jgi:hypothetical protein
VGEEEGGTPEKALCHRPLACHKTKGTSFRLKESEGPPYSWSSIISRPLQQELPHKPLRKDKGRPAMVEGKDMNTFYRNHQIQLSSCL